MQYAPTRFNDGSRHSPPHAVTLTTFQRNCDISMTTLSAFARTLRVRSGSDAMPNRDTHIPASARRRDRKHRNEIERHSQFMQRIVGRDSSRPGRAKARPTRTTYTPGDFHGRGVVHAHRACYLSRRMTNSTKSRSDCFASDWGKGARHCRACSAYSRARRAEYERPS